MDMDIIKLTAQFVARNGQKFLIGLTQRESRNPQFDFLKPTHALFGYFTSLVDAYTKCLMPNKEEEEKEEKDQMAMIDWHDFVVVETIEFTAEDNNIPLAAPIDVSTGAPQGLPMPLDAAGKGTVSQEARIEKPKGVEEEEHEEAEVDLEKEEREKREKEEREKEKEEKEKEKAKKKKK